MKRKLRLYTRFERLWHWGQAFLIIFLLLTGFEIHGSYLLLGYESACHWHNLAGLLLLGLTSFAIFWHLTTGQWRHYLPGFDNFIDIALYYLRGIMRGEPHPFHKTAEQKLNPLQALSYLVLKIIFLPLQLISGALYYFYNDLLLLGVAGDLALTAFLHTLAAWLLLLFLLVHVYLSSTGGRPWTYTLAMITGWEEVEEKA